MQALKALVIGMGVLIVFAIFLLGYGLYKRTVEPDWRLFGPSSEGLAAEQNVAFGDVSLDLAPSCQIDSVTADGARALITIGPDRNCSEVIIIDLQTGAILGRLRP